MSGHGRINLCTIQHSGSKFLLEYFALCGYGSQLSDTLPHSIDFSHFDKSCKFEPHNGPVITTLQHPHRMAVSWLSRDKNLGDLLSVWENCIMFCNTNPVVLFDMNCPEENRKSHLLSILKQVNIYKDEYDGIAEAYAKEWKVVGSKPSTYRDAYLTSSTLPCYNWNRFERAIIWYDYKVKQCVY